MTTPTYLMGRTDEETQRLIAAARILNPFTRRMLIDAGVAPGMRVLDVGTGAGDVALIAAELVGPTGAVVAVDQNPTILTTAYERAQAAGLDHISFVAGSASDVELSGQFDAIVGRLVLMYVGDAAGLLRRLAGYLAPGGVMAFQDFNFSPSSVRSTPPVPLWDTAWGWMTNLVVRAGISQTAGFDLHRILRSAGLSAPSMRLESVVESGPDAVGYAWITDALRSMLPLIEQLGVATSAEVDIDTLAQRLRAATVAVDAVVKAPDVVSAWARLEPSTLES
jgi:2-polyprenyl-3-methyl-5-hydroxy-6-metoxy-1,4-benzoquinol methylase